MQRSRGFSGSFTHVAYGLIQGRQYTLARVQKHMSELALSNPVLCASCESEVWWRPVIYEGQSYCCAGCAAGGPCLCSYDDRPPPEETMQTYQTTSDRPRSAVGLPMTPDVFHRLQTEAERLAAELPDAQTEAHTNGFSGDPESPTVMASGELHALAQRLETVRRVLTEARVVEPDGSAVVGSRITVRDADGDVEEYLLVSPGEADARARRISPESPLGSALLGQRVGSTVEVAAPAGSWQVTLQHVA